MIDSEKIVCNETAFNGFIKLIEYSKWRPPLVYKKEPRILIINFDRMCSRVYGL